MGNVLMTVLTAVLGAGIVKILGQGSVFDKYLRYLCALLLTLGLLSPLRLLLQTDFSLLTPELLPDAGVEKVPESFLQRFAYETEEAVMGLLKEEFDLARDACLAVAFAKDADGMPKLSRVEVTLRTLKAAASTGKIRKRLESVCGCEVIIREEIG